MALLLELGLRIYGAWSGIDFSQFARKLYSSERLPSVLTAKDPRFKGLGKLKPNAQAMAVTSDFRVWYKINSKGLRDEETLIVKTKKRILALGDSFTFGEGVRYGKRYTEKIEELTGSEVINFGVPGYGVDASLARLESEGLAYEPDLVILFMNKVDLERKLQSPGGSPETIYLQPALASTDHRLSLLKESYFLSYSYYLYRLARIYQTLEKSDASIWKRAFTARSDALPATKFMPTSETQYSIDALRRMKGFCETQSIPFLVVNIDPAFHFPFLNDWLGETSYLDLAFKLNDFAKTRSLRFKYDRHYNEETHGFIGERVGDFLNLRSLRTRTARES